MSKHARMVPPDSTPVSECSGCTVTGSIMLVRTGCPRHDPIYYTAVLARHATDSLPVA